MATDTSPLRSLVVAAQALLPEIAEVRRRLHRHPETGLRLPWTAREPPRTHPRAAVAL